MVAKDSSIIIVGGGVFGLSTALWLARGGYKNITIFDRCAFDKYHYDPANNCDGASSDLNKIFRMAYGNNLAFQKLAIESRKMWLEWNKNLSQTPANKLPKGLTPEDELLIICGVWYLAEGPELREYYAKSLKMMGEQEPQLRQAQFLKGSKEEERRLAKVDRKWLDKYHLIDRVNGGDTNGFLDIKAGVTIADKACDYARFLCLEAGVKFVLGDPEGQVEHLLVRESSLGKKVTGIKTCDGKKHNADLVVVAAGGWTASIIPEANRTVETTAGTVLFIDIPKERKDLWEKFSPKNFPIWHYRAGEGDNYYQGSGFPISKGGRLKFGFRGRKFTNFEDHPTKEGLRVSTPRTLYTKHPIDTVPLYGVQRLKTTVGQAFPELKEFGFTDSRLCWYTDSIDTEYVIDYVPGYSDSLFICTAGSGHAFKFLPILGRHVKNQIERKRDQFTDMWKWRVVEEGKPNNGLSEGENGPRVLGKTELAKRRDFSWTEDRARL